MSRRPPEVPLSPDQQVESLRQRGMHIEHPWDARQHLEHINYHRLLPYWDAYLEPDGNFAPGTNFDSVVQRYTFDRKLRLLMLDAIERFEVSLRSRWANHMALKYGPYCLEEPGYFANAREHRHQLSSLLHFFAGNQDEFVQRYRRKSKGGSVPPIWICSEMLSLGQLGRWLENLREPADLQLVSRSYQLDADCFLDFLAHITDVRNLCAHHSRLWNRHLEPFRFPHQSKGKLTSLEVSARSRLFNTIVMVDHLLDLISPGHSWTRRLLHSLHRHPETPEEMGFPLGWQNRSPFAHTP